VFTFITAPVVLVRALLKDPTVVIQRVPAPHFGAVSVAFPLKVPAMIHTANGVPMSCETTTIWLP